MAGSEKVQPGRQYVASELNSLGSLINAQQKIVEMQTKDDFFVNENEIKNNVREKAVKSIEICPDSLFNSYYEIEVTIKGLSPRIWRRILVPGKTSLHTLHDKVLSSVIGWARDYHSYYFRTERETQICWGCPDSGSTTFQDEMCLRLLELTVCDDRQLCIADLLRALEEKLLYVYNITELWLHELTVKAIHPQPPAHYQEQFTALRNTAAAATPTESEEAAAPTAPADSSTATPAMGEAEPVFYVIAGERGCPPEDCGGAFGYSRLLDRLQSEDFDERREAMSEVSGAFNYQHLGRDYSDGFDRAVAQEELMNALTTPPSLHDGANIHRMSSLTGQHYALNSLRMMKHVPAPDILTKIAQAHED
eukprot:GCRY01005024.1.p1 GENE.GCRY01005024.1~~GCRY01005024.1.p1  ORF type:complete len:365 (-),score=80.54 GCRY01005024.1:2-1096(-)